MPRRLRIHVPGGFYHVTLRGNHQRKIFHSDRDAELLNGIVTKALEVHSARLHAYCWMSNHIHMLVQVGADPLAWLMRQVASEFARAMQCRLATTGHFFERRYHATLVDAERYLKEVVRYIHLNPVDARVVRHPHDHHWCSHQDYLGAARNDWVTTDFVLQVFGSTRGRAVAAYEAFMENRDTPEWGAKLEFGGRASDVLGDETFVAKVKASVLQATTHQSLEDLIAEACRRFRVQEPRLVSPIRDPYLAKVRAWVAWQAKQRGIASLSMVARRLARNEATIRQAVRELPEEMK
jgi:REP element-mobilizing transposase RayT